MLIQIIILTLTFPKIDLGACLEFFYYQDNIEAIEKIWSYLQSYPIESYN